MKICSRCKIEKDYTCFSVDSKRKGGLQVKCKKCNSEYSQLHRQRISEANKKRRYINREEKLQKKRDYHKTHKEVVKKWYKLNHQKIYDKRKIYIEKNREYLNQKQKENYYKNRERYLEYARKNLQRRMETDFLFKSKIILRSRVLAALKSRSKKKTTSTTQILGCSIVEAKLHIEKQFKQGMTWDNHGKYTWHIDHIIPLASAKNDDELYKLFHYTNLQPLWATDNQRKGAKILPVAS